MHERAFVAKNRATEIVGRALDASVADETELVWFERRHGRASWPPRSDDRLEEPLLTTLVRVIESGRPGWHRSHVGEVGELENAIRAALTVAQTRPRARRRPVLPTTTGVIEKPGRLFDLSVVRMDVDSARERLEAWCTADGGSEEISAALSWSETRLLVANSHGIRRVSNTTELDLDVRVGPPAHAEDSWRATRASASARSFEDLDPRAVIARARRLSAGSSVPRGALPEEEVSVLLAPEAVIQLLDLLNVFALAGRAYLDGTSFLTRHRDVQVFDRSFLLVDDGRRTPGLPFPFDLEGSPKVSYDLIRDGKPSTPALTQFQGAEAGLLPTAQSIGGQDALFGNLFLECGEMAWEELLAAADGGVFVGWLDRPQCLEPAQLRLRTTARSARRIEGGALGAPLPDLTWETSLLGAFARLGGLGDEAVIRAVPSTPLGAVSAPALVLESVGGLTER